MHVCYSTAFYRISICLYMYVVIIVICCAALWRGPNKE